MAAAAHFSTRVYGMIEGSAPFYNGTAAAFTRTIDWAFAPILSFPTGTTTFHTLANGVLVGGAYVYSVIEVMPSGLNVHGVKYVTDSSVATLATNAG